MFLGSGPDKVQKTLPTGFISTFFMTGIITPDQFPFKGSDDFLVRSYREDCIQALFGLSLLTLLDRRMKLGGSQLLEFNIANQWIKKKSIEK